jgi:hypothetical protein
MKHCLALNPLEIIGVCSVIPFPNAMCRIDPIAEGNLEFIPGGGKGLLEVKPSVPISSCQNFAGEFERRRTVPAAGIEDKILEIMAVRGGHVR